MLSSYFMVDCAADQKNAGMKNAFPLAPTPMPVTRGSPFRARSKLGRRDSHCLQSTLWMQ